MKITSDTITIVSGERDAEGHKLEPEQQPVLREMISSAPIGPQGGESTGKLPVQIQHAMSAQEMANLLRTSCINCVHFDTEAFRRWARACLEGKPEEKDNLRAVLQILAAQGLLADDQLTANLDDRDVEKLIAQVSSGLGVCRAISEASRTLYITHAMGGDPDELPYFQATGAGTRRGSKVFDLIMLKATGRHS